MQVGAAFATDVNANDTAAEEGPSTVSREEKERAVGEAAGDCLPDVKEKESYANIARPERDPTSDRPLEQLKSSSDCWFTSRYHVHMQRSLTWCPTGMCILEGMVMAGLHCLTRTRSSVHAYAYACDLSHMREHA